MIDIKELQICDWVMDVENPAQVTSLTCDGIIETTRRISNIELIEPIPITPEILEKNGFESDTNMFGLCNYELSESYILENRGGRFSFVKRIPGCRSTFHIIDVKYAHELQHCLKLVGIDKTIVL